MNLSFSSRASVYIKDMCQTLEEEGRAGRTRDMFKKVCEITSIFKPRLGVLKNKGGIVLKEGEKLMAVIYRALIQELSEIDH